MLEQRVLLLAQWTLVVPVTRVSFAESGGIVELETVTEGDFFVTGIVLLTLQRVVGGGTVSLGETKVTGGLVGQRTKKQVYPK